MEKKIMTPSQKTMTDGQINKAVARYRALLEKYAKNFDAEAVQTVLGQSEFAEEQVALFRRRVEMVSNLIIRHVKVNREIPPQEVLAATGYTQYTNGDVVRDMLKGEGEEVEVIFFKLDRYVSDDELEREYALRGLVPADPYSLAAVNRDDPTLADAKPNCTHWKDIEGKWCFATFNRWDDERNLRVYRRDAEWGDDWWFAGLRK